jgi:hypothetical protein
MSYSAGAADYNYFARTISNQCKLTNKLILKKTYLGFVRNNQACTGSFAKKLLSTCKEITCESLITTFQESRDRESGTVIGGSL